MILGLSTVLSLHEAALVEDGKILAQKTWPNEKRDAEELVQVIQELLTQAKRPKQDIQKILVVRGPGPFTPLRTGVAFAAALGEALHAKMYSMDTFEYLLQRTQKDAAVLLPAGALDVALFYKVQLQLGHLSEVLAPLPHGKLAVVSQLKDLHEKELHSLILEKGWTHIPTEDWKSLGELLLDLDFKNMEADDSIEPVYMKQPIITPSSNKWKQ